MSHCELVVFREGLPAERRKFSNSWGGAAMVIEKVFDLWVKDPAIPFDGWLSRLRGSRAQEVWDAWMLADVPDCVRAVHLSVFDRALVYRKDFRRFGDDLWGFVKFFDCSGSVCHLPAWANEFYEYDGDKEVEAIGFYHTSCGEDTWLTCNPADDRDIPYDLRTGKDHFDIYERLDNWNKNHRTGQ